MKPTSKLIIFALTFLTLAASTFAQESSSREQFQTAVAACQKTASSVNALAVIKLYPQLDPPPALPEAAREPFVNVRRAVLS
jgi:hypothetical protein